MKYILDSKNFKNGNEITLIFKSDDMCLSELTSHAIQTANNVSLETDYTILRITTFDAKTCESIILYDSELVRKDV